MAQNQNQELVANLEPWFTRSRDSRRRGSNLCDAVLTAHAANDGTHGAGGKLIYGWLADSIQNYGAGYTTPWTELNVTSSLYFATTYGGPYIYFVGGTRALYILDAAWQESAGDEFFVWHWCNAESIATDKIIASKWAINGNNRSWKLYINSAAPAFQFECTSTGAAGTNVASTKVPVVDTWYFVGGYFLSSTLQRIFVGASTDTALTIDDQAAGVPASLFDGSAPLAIGTGFNNALTLLNPWIGHIGIGSVRINVPPGVPAPYAGIDAYASRLFQMTRWFYQ